MLRSGRKARPGNYPVLQKTFLGQTLNCRTPTTTIHHVPGPRFLLREDNSLEYNLTRTREVEHVVPSTITTEHLVCEKYVITQTTQEDEGGFVVRLPTMIDPKQLGFTHLVSERRLHIYERTTI